MSSVESCDIPAGALLTRYREAGAFTDCYRAAVPASVTHSAFVEAFYTTWLFKIERALLRWLAGRGSTDDQARALAEGTSDRFAAWIVEDRTAQQLLVADFAGRTRSWFMVAPATNSATGHRTLLYFGSAVVPRSNEHRGWQRMGIAFHALLGFHKLYSRLLLGSARTRVLAGGAAPGRSEIPS